MGANHRKSAVVGCRHVVGSLAGFRAHVVFQVCRADRLAGFRRCAARKSPDHDAAGGDLQPARQTTVKCEVEDVADAGGTMVLSVIANGTVVKKGEDICRLDSSGLDELAHQEEILLNQAKALLRKAELEVETAFCAARVPRRQGHRVNKGIRIPDRARPI